MAREGLSNRVRKLRRKAVSPAARVPKADEAAKVVKVSAEPAAAPEPNDRDGLIWLAKKKRISAAQAKEGLYYRDLFRAGSAGEASIPSNIPTGAVGGGAPAGMLFERSFDNSAAKLALFVARWNVLLGQSDLLTVMDGVCGIGHTVRYLAGGNQQRAAQLEAALRIALDMMIASRAAKEAALAKFSGKAA